MLKVLNIFKIFSRNRKSQNVDFPQINPENMLINFPELLSYWDSEKNLITTDGITINSNKVVNWKCECGNEWELEVKNMNKRKYKCQKCKKEKNSEMSA